jgi:hypothetical protein
MQKWSPTTKGRIPKLIEKAIIMITQITIPRAQFLYMLP